MELSNKQGNFCWMRQLEIRLYSKLYNVKPLIFGTSKIKEYNYDYKNPKIETEFISDQLNIEVKFSKEISALKDNGTCSISNLTYAEISRIIIGQYYRIEIWAGYKTQQIQCFFKGDIAYISDKIQARRDNTCYIVFASAMVASFSQKRINLNLNSGINLYAALSYMCLTSGIDTSMLDAKLKNKFLSEVSANWGTPGSLAEQIAANDNTLAISTDSSIDSNIIDCSSIQDKRQIRINKDTIDFTKGNPTLNKDGLKMTLLATFSFKPGDIIIIDNSILDLSEQDLSGAQSNFKSNYLDTTFANTDTPNLGAYMIRQINGTFQNRGDAFGLEISARAVSIIKSTLGINY